MEEARALSNAFSEGEIRALAQQLEKSSSLGFDPMTLVKGTVTAVDFAGSPPTVSIQISGDTTTTVSNVRVLDSYSPQVGHTVLIAKQGADILIIGHVADLAANTAAGGAGSWTKATLTAGSHNGDSQGDVFYRRILDNGSWKMQWRGAWTVSGTFMINTGQALPVGWRPAQKRTVAVARNTSGGAATAQMTFHTDGRVELTGGTTAANSSTISGDVGFTSSGGSTGSADTSHNHIGDSGGVTGVTFQAHSHSVSAGHDHGFFGGSHTHTVSSPSWVSLNGVEYFI